MADARVTQAAGLVLDGSDAEARVTQAGALSLSLDPTDARVTQAGALSLSLDPTDTRITSVAVLALTHETPCLQQTCQCWSIARRDGVTLRYTTHDEPVVLQGLVYQPCASLQASASSGAMVSGGVGDTAIRGMLSDDAITAADILGGKYDGALVQVWEQQWGDAEHGFIPRRLAQGIAGKIKQADTTFESELMAPSARLMQRPLLRAHTPACRWDLGDGDCPVDLAALEASGTVAALDARDATARSDYRRFEDSARTEADGYFADGRLTWTSGRNVGVSMEVKTNAAGWVTMWVSTVFPIEVGDAYTIRPGCNKTRDDHTVKFGLDMVDFGGFPDLPGNDEILQTPNAKSS